MFLFLILCASILSLCALILAPVTSKNAVNLSNAGAIALGTLDNKFVLGKFTVDFPRSLGILIVDPPTDADALDLTGILIAIIYPHK